MVEVELRLVVIRPKRWGVGIDSSVLFFSSFHVRLFPSVCSSTIPPWKVLLRFCWPVYLGISGLDDGMRRRTMTENAADDDEKQTKT